MLWKLRMRNLQKKQTQLIDDFSNSVWLAKKFKEMDDKRA